VLLAAGMDTRAYRLNLPAATTIFELDRPDLLRLKDTLLASTPAPRCTRRPVGIDLASDWVAALTAAGFMTLSTIWLGFRTDTSSSRDAWQGACSRIDDVTAI
jgi:methyltransferase (TIGR00027 family)